MADHEDYEYAVSVLRSRDSVADSVAPYNAYWQLLPNVKFGGANGASGSVTVDAFVGEVLSVEAGKGFSASSSDESQVVDFNDSQAKWRTVHLLVKPLESLAGDEQTPTAPVRVGIAVDSQVDPARLMKGLAELQTVVLPVVRNTAVFRYDPAVLSLADGASLIAAVNDSGTLSLPFESDPERSEAMLAATPTLEELREYSRNKTQTI
jgi:hypothetical protein